MQLWEAMLHRLKGEINLFKADVLARQVRTGNLLIFRNMYRKKVLYIAAAMIASLSASSCSNKVVDERFTTPVKTYALWLDSSSKGDIPTNLECMTRASRKFMDLQSKKRDIFISRMVQSANMFKNYSVADERIRADKAVVLIKDPQSDHSVAIPFRLEDGEWKVDLISMFSGMVASGQ